MPAAATCTGPDRAMVGKRYVCVLVSFHLEFLLLLLDHRLIAILSSPSSLFGQAMTSILHHHQLEIWNLFSYYFY
jgi:hypothetical protein